ncbi:MAG TPA: hypothetical protein PLE99_04280 [Candidatus Thiothrix moscowensis]|uniref:hypothetical protein n=1 Tax=unclassified Thiothrix TaxID=2636184 RepID=UPI001A3586D9|nr:MULTISPECIES: hypothetical protein [unclassified Thiothrix]MBJ6611484.1 hypothetical protein [Candidatus Thiothrix moscowensis]HRJ51964.1 hypothetical protein [Candidatus Thiothrix moscowensis]HRJ92279.1 hypothetical protein [Candidatus Thiothrix moscowensis]
MQDGILSESMKGISHIANNPYRHLQKISAEIDSYDTRDKIDRVLDELDFIHELLDPEMQPMVTKVTDALMDRYRALG